jgi:Tfp pilus assembly protein PilN
MSSTTHPEKKELHRARVTAMVYAALTVMSLIFLVYAYIQKTQFEITRERAAELEAQLNLCQDELQELKANQTLKP